MTIFDDDIGVAERAALLKPSLEALLIVASEPITIKEMGRIAGGNDEDLRQALTTLQREYDESQRGFYLAEIAGGYQLRTRPEFERVVKEYVADTYSARLSGAALETLAVVAYRQPVSRSQISSIRGVNSDGVVRMLAARGYIAPTHRDSGPGQASLYTTTSRFLERLGLYSIDDLPVLSEFVPSIEAAEAIEAALLGE